MLSRALAQPILTAETIVYIIARSRGRNTGMKAWSDDHPKAQLMGRKRAAIIDAARSAFLNVGYDGSSMETIATAAGVSIMTLYRHAKSKDELFAAVMLSACEHSHHGSEIDAVSLKDRPLGALLAQAGERFQEKLKAQDTVSLFRTVMAETDRFPHLAEAAYRGFVGSWLNILDDFLSKRLEFHHVEPSDRQALIATFIDDIVGTGILRALLGLNGPSADQCANRSKIAAERLVAKLPL